MRYNTKKVQFTAICFEEKLKELPVIILCVIIHEVQSIAMKKHLISFSGLTVYNKLLRWTASRSVASYCLAR